MPSSSREFLRAALQRLTTANFLLEHKYNLDAMYLAGYTVECSLKALILAATPGTDRPTMLKKLTSGKKMHSAEVLGGILRDLNRPIPVRLAKRFRQAAWSVNLRYESGRTDTGETRAFLKTAKAVYDWVEAQIT
jgi:HEPN domain-containing protein